MKKLLSIILALMLLICLTAFTASANDTTEPVVDHPHTAESNHCYCGDDNASFTNHEHAAVTWQPWTNGMTSPTSGSYYLAEDVTINATISVTGNFKLCLNGYTLTVTNGARAFTNGAGNHRELYICDCSESGAGKITTNNSSNQGGVIYWFRGYIYLFSGTLENTSDSMTAFGGVIRLGQNNATATTRDIQFYMYGGKIIGATTTNNGGSIYGGNSTNLKVHLLGGEITGGSAANGGNICLATGSLEVDGCTISDGSATNGGNIYTAGTMTINSGTISGGEASGEGGNIYVNNQLTVNGGSIYGGTCDGNGINGGNIRVAGYKAFYMNGGTVGTEGQTDVASGYNISALNPIENGFSFTGGTVHGLVRVAITGGDRNVNLSGPVKISGAASNLNIVITGSPSFTLNIGKLEEGANIALAFQNNEEKNAHGGIFATAAADFDGVEYLHCNSKSYLVAVKSGTDLKWTGIQDADGNGYATLNDAATAGKVAKLMIDLADQNITSDVTVDLNGNNLTNTTIAENITVTGIDTTTNLYDGSKCGAITTSDTSAGTVAATCTHDDGTNIRRYLAIENNGSYSFHRYYMAVTSVAVNPTSTAFNYEVAFLGDAAIQQAVTDNKVDFGMAFKADSEGAEWLHSDMDKAFVGGPYGEQNLGYNTYRYGIANVLKVNADNATRAAMDVKAKAYVKVDGEVVGESAEITRTFRQLVEKADAAWAAGTLTNETLQTSLKNMYKTWETVMNGWTLSKINQA